MSEGSEKTTVRGVMIWWTLLVSRARILEMERSSRAFILPARLERLTTARMSSSEASGPLDLGLTSLVKKPQAQMSGVRSTTMALSGPARTGPRLRA